MTTLTVIRYQCDNCQEEFENEEEIGTCKFCGCDICEHCGTTDQKGNLSHCEECDDHLYKIKNVIMFDMTKEQKEAFLTELGRD